MAATITWETLRELAGFRSEKGCAISLYVDLHPSTSPTARDLEGRMNSLIADAEKRGDAAGFSHERKQALKADVRRLRDWWDDEFDRDGAHGAAVFCSSLDNFWRPLPLTDPVRDEVRLGRDLYLAPLVPLVGRGDGALVAFVSRERGVVFRLRGGRLEEVVDQSEEQPGQHDQGGWSQARYQRHIEKLVHDHLKTVGGELDKRVRGAGTLQMVIVAPEEMRGEIEERLSNEAREAIVGWAHAQSHASPTELLEVVKPHLARARERRLEQTLARPPGGRRRSKPRPTAASTSCSCARVRIGPPTSARSAAAALRTTARARSTEPGWSSAPTAGTSRCTTCSRTAVRSSHSGVRTSPSTRASAHCSGSSSG
jgi:peptide chain release factor subunit 1